MTHRKMCEVPGLIKRRKQGEFLKEDSRNINFLQITHSCLYSIFKPFLWGCSAVLMIFIYFSKVLNIALVFILIFISLSLGQNLMFL